MLIFICVLQIRNKHDEATVEVMSHQFK